MLLVGGADFWVVASFFILLPPSEGKAEGGLTTKPWRETSGAFGKQLSAQRTELVQRLVTLKGGDEKLLGVKGVHLGRARAANAHLKGAPSLPAFERYTGVVWDHLDLSTLTAPQRTRALRSIVVVSGFAWRRSRRRPNTRLSLKNGRSQGP